MRFVFWIVGGFCMYLGMYILATTADCYLSPCLEFITQRFGFSESLAGVTLLAFGNGAPDVFQGIEAAKSNGAQLDATKAISILIGGTFFISSVVISCVAYTASKYSDKRGPLRVTPSFFIRDIAFLMITTSYLLFIMVFIHSINIIVSLGLILIYIIYVIMVMA
jgi:sodium/potassium/calcium exchanger 6